MTSDAVRVVRAFIAAINRRSLPQLGALMSRNHTFVDPQGRAMTGRDETLAAWQTYFEMFPDYQICAERIVADGTLVAVFGDACGTFKGARGASAENRIAMPAAWMAQVRRGRLIWWQVYADWSEGMKIIARASQDR